MENCCDGADKQTMSFNITNSGDEAKTFRLFGGGTGLESIEDNTTDFFDTGTGFNNTVNASIVQSDGSILLGGDFTSYNGTASNRIIRLTALGVIDSSFVIGTGFNGAVNSIAVQSDGKILIGGAFTSYNGTSVNRIVRLSSAGVIDNTFSIGTGFNGAVLAIAVQSNGSILMGGQFTSYNGTAASLIIRLTTLGAVDGTFVYGSGFNTGSVASIAVQSNGSILVGGSFTSYDGTGASYIIRLTTLGAVDGTFVYGTGFSGSRLHDIKIQSDGKIIVAGNFSSYNGTAAEGIIRLTALGAVDGTFIYGTGFNSGADVVTLSIQSNGKILVGGDFTSYNGTSTNDIIRLSSTGSVDSSFDYGTGSNSNVNTIGLNSDDSVIYIAGGFTSYDGETANYITGLNSDGSINVSTVPVTIVVNGGASTVDEINNDTLSNPICICDLNIVGSAKNVFNTPLRKNFTAATGTIDNTLVSLLAKFTAMQKDGINVINLDSSDFNNCVLDGNNYLQWVIPAGENISIDIKYCQDSLLDKIMLKPRKQAVKIKKYIHGRFKYLLN